LIILSFLAGGRKLFIPRGAPFALGLLLTPFLFALLVWGSESNFADPEGLAILQWKQGAPLTGSLSPFLALTRSLSTAVFCWPGYIRLILRCSRWRLTRGSVSMSRSRSIPSFTLSSVSDPEANDAALGMYSPSEVSLRSSGIAQSEHHIIPYEHETHLVYALFPLSRRLQCWLCMISHHQWSLSLLEALQHCMLGS
jgi:hypothetical protein